MKKLLVFILALGLFSACKDKKAPDPRDKGDYYKDDYRNDDRNNNNNGDDENRNNRNNRNNDDENTNNDRNNDEPSDNGNTGGSWGSANEDVFVSNCVSSAASSGTFTKAQAKSYCSCMLEKLERKYPNPEDISGMDENDPVMLRMAKECVADLQ
ncbi:MAG: hypothetical protein IPP93_03200 [Chitinophagaceae bacterium]|nr:hypothetical protein [Chitinophagaceae bacterium]MBL0334475.1 hypothetical protein [Chitinophagaceae bacterium]